MTEKSAFEQALKKSALVIEQAIDSLLVVPTTEEARLVEAMRYASLGGGKRVRGVLALESAALFGVDVAKAARVGAALEMFHAFSLVHDDLPAMDDDDLRRGKPSTHKAFDEATAILAGDALQGLSSEILAEPATHADPAVRIELVLALARAGGVQGMIGGQMIDMVSEGKDLSAAQVSRLQALKTGRLIQVSAEAGAVLGQASPAERQALADYGRDLGAAFQIADDVLDVKADTEVLGKTAGKDQEALKATMVAVLGLEEAEKEAGRLAKRAQAHLDIFGNRAEFLRDLASYVVFRQS